MAEATKRYAVVTGANKGIGLEISKQLASKGIMVVLTARYEMRGIAAVENLKELGLSDNVVFHQLDVADPASVASLVNNAGISGVKAEVQALQAAGFGKPSVQTNWASLMTQTPNFSDQCLQTNYYGAKRMYELLIHLLQRSDSPRIVNVSSSMGKLKNVSNEWEKAVFGDVENLTEEKVDEVLRQYVKDFEEDINYNAGILSVEEGAVSPVRHKDESEF
ncbi:putative NAD(P)-binding Rossmann-fold superfamily protein [Hibiscus syriacus]|uniref:NAD(P)-binding Rossmann-fold superfamily protein n=1 Tax=Hibiscus syriacus TaxID=106335 RepID=A0A6A3C5K9_HIBSY|nr:putative NAD(P)-binding Rossmann-fold superfamily protein [Hibiscus syriacus]